MRHTLSLRPRALAELADARRRYKLVGHDKGFLAELDSVLEMLQVMPRRFPVVRRGIHRALLRRYPFAIFFRIRATPAHVVVLAVIPQRGDPAKWPSR
jgi:plasmid stabilization system protein ParE